MVIKKINIDTVEKVKALVKEATATTVPVDIMTDNFTVDAKSILGIFSLNRNAPVTLSVGGSEDNPEVIAFLNSIDEFLI